MYSYFALVGTLSIDRLQMMLNMFFELVPFAAIFKHANFSLDETVLNNLNCNTQYEIFPSFVGDFRLLRIFSSYFYDLLFYLANQ